MMKAAPRRLIRRPRDPSKLRQTRAGIVRRQVRPARGGFIGLLAIVILVGFTSLEGLAHGDDHPTDLRNNRNQFVHLRPLRGASLAPILAEDGSLLNLDRFRGKVVLLNFWATWCPPCVDELPALDHLQELLGSEAFTVVALSIDDARIDVPVSFVRRLGLKNLSVYHDFTGRMQEAFPLYGLPITYLIDQDGLVVGYIVGAAEWDSPEALEFLRHYIRVRPAASSPAQRSGGLLGMAAVQGATKRLQGIDGS